MTSIEVSNSKDEIILLADAVLDRTLPKTSWTHAAHLAVAFELLNRRDLVELTITMPDPIRRYNEATNTPNTDNSGYHETITQFYLKAIDHFIYKLPKDHDYLSSCNRLITGDYGRSDFTLRYYSEKLLFSVKARREWVEPDLGELIFP